MPILFYRPVDFLSALNVALGIDRPTTAIIIRADCHSQPTIEVTFTTVAERGDGAKINAVVEKYVLVRVKDDPSCP